MGQKKDIGTLFKNKLNDGKRNPSQSLWEKINTSLDEEKRRKKRILFYWLVGGGLSVLLGLVFLFADVSLLQSNRTTDKKPAPLNALSCIPSETENNESSSEISPEETLIVNIKSEEKLSKTNSQTKGSDFEKKVGKSTKTGKSFDENYKVSENYYYYNSSNGKQIITTDKKDIDSLISDQYKSLDSTTTHKTNNTEQ